MAIDSEDYPVDEAEFWADEVCGQLACAHAEQLYRPVFVPSDSFRGRAEAVAGMIAIAVNKPVWRTTAEFDQLLASRLPHVWRMTVEFDQLLASLLPQARRLMPLLPEQTLRRVIHNLVLARTAQDFCAAACREFDEKMDKRDADDAASR